MPIETITPEEHQERMLRLAKEAAERALIEGGVIEP